MVAFVVSLVVLIASVAVVPAYARRRPVGAPLTWGEAMLAATYLFFVMFLAYGIVPHQWLTWADNELNWRSDVFFPKTGVSFFGRGRIMIPMQVYRDLVVMVIYGGAVMLHILGWLMWQRRGQRRAEAAAAIQTSKFGRPLLKAAD